MNKKDLIQIYQTIEKAHLHLRSELMKVMTWRELSDMGLKVAAIIKFRDSHKGTTLLQAKEAIEAYQNS